jgi:hypothetical protein
MIYSEFDHENCSEFKIKFPDEMKIPNKSTHSSSKEMFYYGFRLEK